MKHSKIKTALVCDWLCEIGGAEKVLLALYQAFPNATIYTSQYRPKRINWFKGAKVKTGWIDILPRALRKFIAPLRVIYFNNLDLSDYDVVISVANAEAKGVKTGDKTVHISYLQGPPVQYYWGLYDSYIENPGFSKFNFLARTGLRLLIKIMRKADFKASKKPDYLVANSNYVAAEIKKYYKRDSRVVFPPVAIDEIKNNKVMPINPFSGQPFFMVAGRQVNWKRFDLAVKACMKLQKNLLVIGDGPEHNSLVELAKKSKNIKFLPRYNGVKEIKSYFLAAEAMIFPSLEPFGIVAVEALAAGLPLIALDYGGAKDIVNKDNGCFFENQTVDGLADVISKFKKSQFNKAKVSCSADQFKTDNFKTNFKKLVKELYNDKNK